MNKLIINGKEIELSKETVKSMMQVLVEPEDLVPESIDLFETDGVVFIGFGGKNQHLGYCHVHDTWEVQAFSRWGSKGRFKLVKTTFGKLEKGDVFIIRLNFKDNVENYHIKTSYNQRTNVSEDRDGTWDVSSWSDINQKVTVYKVVRLDD